MIVLAIDAAPKNTGYAVFKDDKPVERGKIKLEKKKLKSGKFQKLTVCSNNYPSLNLMRKFDFEANTWPWFCKAVKVVLKNIQQNIGMPDFVAMDQYFYRPKFNANTSAIFGVAEVTGALMFAIHDHFGLETIRVAPATKYAQFKGRPEFVALKKERKAAKDKLKAAKNKEIKISQFKKKQLKKTATDSTANKKALVVVLKDIYSLSSMSLDEADAMALARYIYRKKSSETGSLL